MREDGHKDTIIKSQVSMEPGRESSKYFARSWGKEGRLVCEAVEYFLNQLSD